MNPLDCRTWEQHHRSDSAWQQTISAGESVQKDQYQQNHHTLFISHFLSLSGHSWLKQLTLDP